MQNSMVMLNFSFFDWEHLFRQIWSKNSKLLVWAEISHKTNLNMQNYVENIWCSLFLFYTRKTLFRQIWSKKIKIISLSGNLVPRPIWICRIQWWYSLFLNIYPSWANMVQKFKIVWSKWNLIQRLIRICKVNGQKSILSVLDWKKLFFGGKFGPKNHIYQFKPKIAP